MGMQNSMYVFEHDGIKRDWAVKLTILMLFRRAFFLE